MKRQKINYSATGVDYNVMDPLKKLAQNLGRQTSKNLLNFGYKEVEQSRGESAYVWEEEDCYRAFVIEGLGTKNLVADEMQKITGSNYYRQVAQDTVAAIVNDILTVGAIPQVINAYFGSGGPDWYSDTNRSSALVEGFAKACDLSGATWGGGETPGLKGIINEQTLDLAGSCVGIIKPKQRLTLGEKLTAGDAILLVESSGIHANGLSLARSVAGKLPEGYQTKFNGGMTFGDAILIPSHIYVSLIKDLFDAEIDIHYMVNITGHGWRKLMRANKQFTYTINQLPTPQPIFDFIQKNSGNSDEEMYANFNMGTGFAIYLPKDQVEEAQKVSKNHNLKSWNAGTIEESKRQVVIKPKNITFASESLDLR